MFTDTTGDKRGYVHLVHLILYEVAFGMCWSPAKNNHCVENVYIKQNVLFFFLLDNLLLSNYAQMAESTGFTCPKFL
jgi:hypothetical protein